MNGDLVPKTPKTHSLAVMEGSKGSFFLCGSLSDEAHTMAQWPVM